MRPSSRSSTSRAMCGGRSATSGSSILCRSTMTSGPGTRTRTSTGLRTTSSIALATSATSISGRASTTARRTQSARCSQAKRCLEPPSVPIARPRGYRRRRRISAGNAFRRRTRARRSQKIGSGTYSFPPTLAEDGFSYAGRWRIEGERSVAGKEARLRIRAYARLVHLVLRGRGKVQVLIDGRRYAHRCRDREQALHGGGLRETSRPSGRASPQPGSRCVRVHVRVRAWIAGDDPRAPGRETRRR